MKINHLEAFNDNYIWTMESEGKIAIVDPGDAKPIHEYIRNTGYVLTDVLVTHHHWDHTGGLEEVIEEYKCQAYGPSGGHIKGITKPLHDNENFTILDRYKFRAFSAPGHTNDQLSYFCDETDKPILFSGDTLFSLGCGRVFEGTASEMWKSLKKIRELPDETTVYCGHEYTESNTNFATFIDSDNVMLKEKKKQVLNLRKANQPTVPFNLGEDKLLNPFLRVDEGDLSEKLNLSLNKPAEVFAKIRKMKDNF